MSDSVAVLMATRNGERFLDEQMRSLAGQSHPAIDLWISDDGSTDATHDILAEWRENWHKGALHQLTGPGRGFAENFRSLIINGRIDADYFAFCDQDDVWEPDKLTRALAWMKTQPPELPLLFCSRTMTISDAGMPTGQSPLFSRMPSFHNALVQSLAGGNTMVFNRVARERLAAASKRTDFVSHDWWTYLIVTGTGGLVHYSQCPLVRYRQHATNIVGSNTSWQAKWARLKRTFMGQFAVWTDINLTGLERSRDLLTPEATVVLDVFERARHGSATSRMRDIRQSGVYRQTRLGNLQLWSAVALGWT